MNQVKKLISKISEEYKISEEALYKLLESCKEVNKGRPRKASKMVESESVDLFSSMREIDVDVSEKKSEMDSELMSLYPAYAEHKEKKRLEEEEMKEKEEMELKKATAKIQKDIEKAAKKEEMELKKAALKEAKKDPAKELEKAQKAALKEAKELEKSQKAALKDEKAQKALEKAALKEQKALEKAAKEALKAEKALKKGQKSNDTKAELKVKKAEKESEKVVEKVVEEVADVVRRFEFEGVKYLKSKNTGIIYNMEQDVIGKWNEEEQKIDFKEDEGEEEEEDYDV
jgi:dGTP triphosphohydrolase